MNRVPLRRGALAFVVLVGVLFAQTSASSAQAPGSELTEDVSSEVAGADASIPLQDVSAFASAGEAVFEPGSINEEIFTYSSVNVEDNLLVGVTRPAPISHSAGVFVQAPQGEPTSAPEATASDDAEDQQEADQRTDADSSEDVTAEGNYDPVCEAVAGTTCAEVADGACGEGAVCEVVNDPLGPIGCSGDCDPIDDIEIDDVCDPKNTGQTCSDVIAGVLVEVTKAFADPCGYVGISCSVSEPCDPQTAGEACDDLKGVLMDINTTVNEVNTAVNEALQFEPCDLWFPSSPHVGDLGPPINKSGVVIGDAASYCPGLPYTLIVCMEYGPISVTAPENCEAFPGAPPSGKADGVSFGACSPGMWRTYAAILMRGEIVQDGHSGTVTITHDECLGPAVLPEAPPSPTWLR